MSDQIVVMNQGRIEQMGDPRTLYLRPQSVFVANFIGEANLLPASVVGADAQGTAVDWNGRQVAAAASAHGAKPGDSVYVVVRPEAIRLSNRPGEAGNAFSGKIRHRVFKGNHSSVTVEVDDGSRLNALVHLGDIETLPGEDVWLSWKPQNATVIRNDGAQP